MELKNKFPIWKIPISSIAGDFFTSQQDNAPANRAGDTVEFLSRNTLDFISHRCCGCPIALP